MSDSSTEPTQSSPGSKRRISIADLLWFMAFVAATLAFAQQMMPENDIGRSAMALLATIVVFILPLASTIHSPSNRALKIIVFGMLWLVILGLGQGAYSLGLIFWLTVFLLVALKLLGLREIPYRHAFRCGFGLVIAAFFLFPAYERMFPTEIQKRLIELRAQFPETDLSPRLARYEKVSHTDKANEPLTASPTTESELSKLETWFSSGDESPWYSSLKDIHDAQFQRFTRAPGFGNSRMGPDIYQIPNIETLAQVPFRPSIEKTKNTRREESKREWFFNSSSELPANIFDDSVESRHRTAYIDFLHPSGLGYFPSVQKTVRFVPHGFHYPIEPVTHDDESLELKKLELIGWMDGDPPRAYVLEHLPKMDEIRNNVAPTRPLDDFETTALAKLNEGETIVFEKDDEGLRMLGAIRAIENCLECHDVQRGEMLGAFTYLWSK